MDRETISKLLKQRPFKPFELHMSSGEVHLVRHPELAVLGKSLLVIVNSQTDEIDILGLLHVAHIHASQAA